MDRGIPSYWLQYCDVAQVPRVTQVTRRGRKRFPWLRTGANRRAVLLALELKAMKVDPETRQRVKVLAAEQRVEMWELVRELVNEAWLKRPQNQPPSDREEG